MDSLYLLQWIFPTQKLNRGLLHCRQILYQLSYQGSPKYPQRHDQFDFRHLLHKNLCVCSVAQLYLKSFAIPWTIAHQIPLPMEFSRQVYWSGEPFPPPRYLSDLGIKPASLSSPVFAGIFFITSDTWEVTPQTLIEHLLY